MASFSSSWAADGEEADVKALVTYLEENFQGNCANCRCPGCRYNGLNPENLPDRMKKRDIDK